jgi:hypothetical protein
VADAAATARSMWTLFEPIHAVTYFAPERGPLSRLLESSSR